jgi:hypothetical protein
MEIVSGAEALRADEGGVDLLLDTIISDDLFPDRTAR